MLVSASMTMIADKLLEDDGVVCVVCTLQHVCDDHCRRFWCGLMDIMTYDVVVMMRFFSSVGLDAQ